MRVEFKFFSKKLDRDMRPSFIYHYAVTGKGKFPLDMLRSDACWIRSSGDVEKFYDEGERIIRITSYMPPTEDRWKSFGWTVIKE
jgi:hypothetical protein